MSEVWEKMSPICGITTSLNLLVSFRYLETRWASFRFVSIIALEGMLGLCLPQLLLLALEGAGRE